MAHAHSHVTENLQIESETGKLGIQIIATLIGGMMLVCSFVAQMLFENDFYPTVLGAISALLLGTPLIWVAIKDLAHGHMHMNELVALAVLAAFAMGSYHEVSDHGWGAGGYQEAGVIAFFMILSVLIENRTALITVRCRAALACTAGGKGRAKGWGGLTVRCHDRVG